MSFVFAIMVDAFVRIAMVVATGYVFHLQGQVVNGKLLFQHSDNGVSQVLQILDVIIGNNVCCHGGCLACQRPNMQIMHIDNTGRFKQQFAYFGKCNIVGYTFQQNMDAGFQ